MFKRLLALIIFGLGAITAVNAENNPGYVYTGYGEVVKDGYAQCVRTAYYDSSDDLAECDEDSSSKNASDSAR